MSVALFPANDESPEQRRSRIINMRSSLLNSQRLSHPGTQILEEAGSQSALGAGNEHNSSSGTVFSDVNEKYSPSVAQSATAASNGTNALNPSKPTGRTRS